MNFNSIRVKYTATFCAIAVFFIIQVLMSFALVSKTENGMQLFGENFNPAISAVINADRDLYQARVAELEVLYPDITADGIAAAKADFEENAQQAYDRMQKYKQLLTMYPDISQKLSTFKTSFDNWKSAADKVFSLAQGGESDAARALSYADSLAKFNELRSVYNTAGELADGKSASTSQETLDEVSHSQFVLAIVSFIVIAATLFSGIVAPKAMADALENLSSKIKGLNLRDPHEFNLNYQFV